MKRSYTRRDVSNASVPGTALAPLPGVAVHVSGSWLVFAVRGGARVDSYRVTRKVFDGGPYSATVAASMRSCTMPNCNASLP
jgi:hypothetical protein